MNPTEFCDHSSGPDGCHGLKGHDGDHCTYWGRPGDKVRPIMTWTGTEPWARHRGSA